MEERKKGPLTLARQTAARRTGGKEKPSMKHYSTKNTKMKVFTGAMALILSLIICWGAMEVYGLIHRPVNWEPTVSYPMVNTNVSWEQTFHSGTAGM